MPDEFPKRFYARLPSMQSVADSLAEICQDLLRANGLTVKLTAVVDTAAEFATKSLAYDGADDPLVAIDNQIRVSIAVRADSLSRALQCIEGDFSVLSSKWEDKIVDKPPAKRLKALIPDQAKTTEWSSRRDVPTACEIVLFVVDEIESADSVGVDDAAIDMLLSGGGYRATVFHVGVLRYLYEHRRRGGAECLLAEIKNVIGVSGGSVTAAHFAANRRSYLNKFATAVDALMSFVRSTDIRRSILKKQQTASDLFAELLGSSLSFADIEPEIDLHILGTDLRSGGCVSFSREGVRHFVNASDHAGHLYVDSKLFILRPELRVCCAIAASAAFPPVFSPLLLDKSHFAVRVNDHELGDLTTHPIADGGIRDNLGVEYYECVSPKFVRETNARDCIISDAGRMFDWATNDQKTESVTTWIQRLSRTVDIQGNRLTRIDSDRVPGALWISISGSTDAPMRGDAAKQAFAQSLTRAIATKVARTATDMVPLTQSEIYAIARLGYDVAERSFGKRNDKLELRDEIVDRDFWQNLFPEAVAAAGKNVNAQLDQLTENVAGESADQFKSIFDAVQHLPELHNPKIWGSGGLIVVIVGMLCFGLGWLACFVAT